VTDNLRWEQLRFSSGRLWSLSWSSCLLNQQRRCFGSAHLTVFWRVALEALPAAWMQLRLQYLHAVTKAKLDWLCSVIDELRLGTLSWSYQELAEAAKQFLG
jgi:hypothetical protein